MNSENPMPVRGGDYRLPISVLSITATIMLVGLFVVSTMNRNTLAIGQNDRGGDYIMTTMQFSSATENVIVTDAANGRMIAYGMNLTNYRIDPWSVFDLSRLREVRQDPGDADTRERRDRRERR